MLLVAMYIHCAAGILNCYTGRLLISSNIKKYIEKLEMESIFNK